MASTYSQNLKIELIGTGEQAGAWGTTTNTNLGTAVEEAIAGYATANFASDADLTLTLTNSNATQVARHFALNVTSGVSLTTTRNLIVPTIEKPYVIKNATTGGQSIVVKTSAGSGITVGNGLTAWLYVDGTNVVQAMDSVSGAALVNVSATQTLTNKTLTTPTISGGTINNTPIGGTTAAAGSFTTLTTSSTVTHNAGTANGVAYLNGSKVLTSGSALTYSGGALLTTGSFAATDGTNIGEIKINAATLDFNTSSIAVPQVFSLGSFEQMRLTSTGLGIGTSSPGQKLHVAGNIRTGNSLIEDTGTNVNFGAISAGYLAFLAAGGSEQMRLTSTGLGIGTSSPSQKLEVNGAALVNGTSGFIRAAITGSPASGAAALQISINSTNARTIRMENTISGGHTYDIINGAAGVAGNLGIYDDTAGAYRLTLDSSGNLGLGVTPSAWNSGLRAIQVGYSAAIDSPTSVANTRWSNNAFVGSGGGFQYINAGVAQVYEQDNNGKHVWLTAPSGTAGNAISFTQAMTLTAGGNQLLGTTSDSGERLVVVGAANTDQIRFSDATNATGWLANRTGGLTTLHTNGVLAFGTGNGTFTERARIDSSGNLGIGVTNPGCSTDVRGANGLGIRYIELTTGNTNRVELGTSSGTGYINTNAGAGSTALAFRVADTERARIDSSGNLLVGTTSGAMHTLQKTNPGDYAAKVVNASGSVPYGLAINYTGVSGGTGSPFLACNDDANRFRVLGNGNAENINNSYGGISDLKLKENITDATPKLNGLMQVRVVNYNLKFQPDQKHIGVIAQELEQVFPGLVEESQDRDADGELNGETTKSVKYSVFVPMLIKAMQEQQALIESLTARVAALEAA